tara:strand:- start:117 stop:386 length:270 start_codon:yes stop_codon:yes gene_type:complete
MRANLAARAASGCGADGEESESVGKEAADEAVEVVQTRFIVLLLAGFLVCSLARRCCFFVDGRFNRKLSRVGFLAACSVGSRYKWQKVA